MFVVVTIFSSVSVFVPGFLTLFGFWLWLSDNGESVILKSSDFFSLEVSHGWFSFK
jgi:hypothetical protein